MGRVVSLSWVLLPSASVVKTQESAKLLRKYMGNRKSGFLFETETRKMLWPGTLYRDGLKTTLKGMGRERSAATPD